ncbi:MAG TPA: cell division protein FtsK, partial [Pelotomaculum sp.]|nr:cell division protein FtsK [Pelotomaculum sp.]
LFKATPDEVKFLMIDPKMVELATYNGIPHLASPVVTDPRKAATSLRWAAREMERRYTLFASVGVRDITRYNKVIKIKDPGGAQPLPFMVV